MSTDSLGGVDRRTFIRKSLEGVAFISLPALLKMNSPALWPRVSAQDNTITYVFRKEILFAGIRKPIKKREELNPRIEKLKAACTGKTVGPLTHIIRFDTPVDGIDSEIGFPVSAGIKAGDIITHKLRSMHFYSLIHAGP